MNDNELNKIRKQSFSQKISFFAISNFYLLKWIFAFSVLSLFLMSFGKITYQVFWELKDFFLYPKSFYTKNIHLKDSVNMNIRFEYKISKAYGHHKLFNSLCFIFKIILGIFACLFLYEILLGFLLSRKIKWNEFKDILQAEKENFELFGRMVKIVRINSVTMVKIPRQNTSLPIRSLITVFDYKKNQNLNLVLISLIPNDKLYYSIVDHCKMTNKRIYFRKSLKSLSRSYKFYLFKIINFFVLSYYSGFYLFKANNEFVFFDPELFEKKVSIDFNEEAENLCTIKIIGYEEEQKKIEKIRKNIESKSQNNKNWMIIHGPSGTGKSTAAINFLINCSYEGSNLLCFKIDSENLSSFLKEIREKNAKYNFSHLEEDFILFCLKFLHEEFENENKRLQELKIKTFEKIVIFIDGVSASKPIKKNFNQYAWQKAFININTKEGYVIYNYYEKLLNKFFFVLTVDSSQSIQSLGPILKFFPNVVKFDYPDFETAHMILSHYFIKFISHQKSLSSGEIYPIHPLDQSDQFYRSYKFRKNKDRIFPILTKDLEKEEIEDFLKKLIILINYGNFSNKYPFVVKSEFRDWISKESCDSTNSNFFIGGEKISTSYQVFVKIVSNIYEEYDCSKIDFKNFKDKKNNFTGAQISSLFSEEYWITFMSRHYSIFNALKENNEIDVLKAILFETVTRVT